MRLPKMRPLMGAMMGRRIASHTVIRARQGQAYRAVEGMLQSHYKSAGGKKRHG